MALPVLNALFVSLSLPSLSKKEDLLKIRLLLCSLCPDGQTANQPRHRVLQGRRAENRLRLVLRR